MNDKTKCKKLTGNVQLNQTIKLVKLASKTFAKQQSNKSVQTPDKRVPRKRKTTDVCEGEKPTKKPAITTDTEQVHVDIPPKMVSAKRTLLPHEISKKPALSEQVVKLGQKCQLH